VKKLCMPTIISKRSTVTVNREYVFSMDCLDLSNESTCPQRVNELAQCRGSRSNEDGVGGVSGND